MRDRAERFAFPFSVGCVSHSSVDIVVGSQPKSSRADQYSNAVPTISNAKTKTSLLKPNISAGIVNKVIKGFKNLSYMFQFYKDEEEEDEERDMVIGFPTDVQHVAHIGWDGFNSTSTAAMKSWDHKAAPDHLLSLPSISQRQFELAMAASPED